MNDVLLHARSILAISPVRWLSLCQTLDARLLALPPAPKEWGAVECLQHLVDTEHGVFPVRVRALLAGLDFPAFDPDKEGTRAALTDPVALATEFARLRKESLALIDTLTKDDLTRTARHMELGMVTLEELLHEWAGHDLMHTVQAERALMQPFIRGCGPWVGYFADHDSEKHG